MKLLPESVLQVNFHLFQNTGEDAMLDPLGKKFANYTHIMVSLLKAWKVTIVGIECNRATLSSTSRAQFTYPSSLVCTGNIFLMSFHHFIEGPHQKLFFQGFFPPNYASKMAYCIIVDIVNYLMLLLANS